MPAVIPKKILDDLTRVQMPRGIHNRPADDKVHLQGLTVPIHRVPALVVGSGAAGLRTAVELKRRGVDVAVMSTGLFSGTSACSGSDKQTIHSAGTSNRGDDFVQLAKDIGMGGAMDKDTAYIEAVGSVQAFSGLQYMGLPLPQDRFGAVLRYQTDHDEVGRATSCGPRTSKLMVKVLCEEALRLGVDFLKGLTAVRLISEGADGSDRVKGMIAIDRDRETNEFGLVLILCDQIVLATGGPGELYRDSVYPRNCFGSLGLALEVGIKCTNLTECQFGIGTRRTEFPWNLSGTYVQVMPHIYSVDEEGVEHNFLGDFFRTTQEMVSNVFRKGYQWPFHATRTLNYQSSLVDLAIFIESKKGRDVLMDFTRNPLGVSGDRPFDLNEIDDDVKAYLLKNDAMQSTPIERLRRMNPLAIELYKNHGKDIEKEPLLFNVNHQHMNGGVDVDIWGQSSLQGCYAVGEVAGTHGVTRPGGAALNAGQVFSLRCAQHIANQSPSVPALDYHGNVKSCFEGVVSEIKAGLDQDNGLGIDEIRQEVQGRMSDDAGFICDGEAISLAKTASNALNQSIARSGLKYKVSNIAQAFQWKQTALLSEAVLTALNHYVKNGGGSRGARALCSSKAELQPEANGVDLSQYAFIEEKDDDKLKKIVIRLERYSDNWLIEEQSLRDMESPAEIHFEKNWGPFLTSEQYQDGFLHA